MVTLLGKRYQASSHGLVTEAFKCHSTCHDGEINYLVMSTYFQHYVDMAR